MSTLPEALIDRWENRAEPGPGEGMVYWHMLMRDHPQVAAMAQKAQAQLAQFNGLHMTPLKWLHMTTLIAGSTADISSDRLEQMVSAASQLLSGTGPITVTVGELLYHPEAIMLGVRPKESLMPVFEAVRTATRTVTGKDGLTGNGQRWTPHITVCYSTSSQPAQPIIAALGQEMPKCEVDISSVSLVIQRGAERLWDWHPVETVCFGASAGECGA
jgi:2'-5' RNA ligase